MRSTIFYTLSVGLLFSANSQAQELDTLFINENKFITVQFDKEVKLSQSSQPDLLYIEPKNELLFIQALEKGTKESNLFVQTVDGTNYNFLLLYTPNLRKLNYSFGKPSAQAVDHAQEQALGQTSSPSVELPDENPLEGFRGYVNSRNRASKGNVELYFKGIYYKDDYLYFLFNMENNSNLSYELSNIGFFVTAEGKSKNLATQQEEMPSLKIYNRFDTLEGKQKTSFTVAFRKFTLIEKNLLVEVLEKGGDRNLTININADIINSARNL